MYNDLINLLQQDLLINKYNEKLIPFWLGNLKCSREYDEYKQRIILKVNEMYKKEKIGHHSKVSFLLGLISFLNKIKNYDDYSLLSFYFLGFYFCDYDNDELESFVNAKISPKIINIIAAKVDSLYEKSSYLDYYQGKDYEILDDFTNKTSNERREKIGFAENASFDGRYTYEIRRIWL